MQLSHKVVAITGAGRGLGRAIALAFAAQGAEIAALDLRAPDLDETCAQCRAQGVRATPYLVNVTDEAQVIQGLDAVVATFGRLDVLVNNAGITKDALLVKAQDGAIVAKMSREQWQAVIDVNLTGVFLCAREAAERMIRLGNGGLIINISSISREGNPGQTNYSATKAGVAAMTVVWAKELARYGIRSAAIRRFHDPRSTDYLPVSTGALPAQGLRPVQSTPGSDWRRTSAGGIGTADARGTRL